MKSKEVKDFFNSIAHEYSEKYSIANPLHNWYFGERLIAATGKDDYSGKNILDIGAGTGALYDFLLANGFAGFNFIGCDIAAKMLENSHIPAENRFVGHCYDLDIGPKSFDYIFVLGVTTYIDEKERNRTLEFIRMRLSTGGTAVISFTNKESLNQRLYDLVRPFLKMLTLRNRVAVQSFPTFSYSFGSIFEAFKDKFDIAAPIYINQTFFPFNHLLPATSIRVAKFIQRNVRKIGLRSFLSSEFIIMLRPKKSD
jgi:SAM-dependent methyltransferase